MRNGNWTSIVALASAAVRVSRTTVGDVVAPVVPAGGTARKLSSRRTRPAPAAGDEAAVACAWMDPAQSVSAKLVANSRGRRRGRENIGDDR